MDAYQILTTKLMEQEPRRVAEKQMGSTNAEQPPTIQSWKGYLEGSLGSSSQCLGGLGGLWTQE